MEKGKTNNISKVDSDCIGCSNCFHICPKSAIDVKADSEGFLYPAVNASCINCGACVKVCPQLKNFFSPSDQSSYGAISKDIDILKNASSGGVFGTIAKYFLSLGDTYICAASYEKGDVKHIITNSLDDVKRCQGSKYVQSNLDYCLPNLKRILNVGNRVLFCGTPCQVAAVYAFLKDRPRNLLTLDLICHGVPSPLFLKKNLEHYSRNIADIKDLRFRWKNPASPTSFSGFFLYFKKKQESHIYSSSYDPYYASFMRGESFRLSCYKCRYANINRCGDITIGDFDSHKLYPNFHPGSGKSTVIVNTDKGGSLWEEVNEFFDFIEIDLQKESEANHQLSFPFGKPSVRKDFYYDVEFLSFKKLRKKYARPSTFQQKLLFCLQSYFPSIYKMLILNHTKKWI